MTPSEKYTEEKDTIKAQRMNRIMESAFNLFSQKGIDTITMNDIAQKAEIGVASLYRYYETKEKIAIKVTIWAWEKEKSIFLPKLLQNDYEKQTGLEQIEKVISIFIDIFDSQPDFLRYIYFFDSYAVRSKMKAASLRDYESLIDSIKKLISKALKKGIEDNSIQKKYAGQEEKLYFTLMQTMFSSSQKLALNENLLDMDKKIDAKEELKMLSDIIINGIKE